MVAAARYSARVKLDESPALKERVEKSRNVIVRAADAGMSIYGVSTGYGGSGESPCIAVQGAWLIAFIADTRTNDTLALGSALLQHQHIGILPSSTTPLDVLPILEPLASTSMPESWVRGAILIRMNSLIRGMYSFFFNRGQVSHRDTGHSGVRWKLIEKMGKLLRENITPMIPMRGSISASGGSRYAPKSTNHDIFFPYRNFRRSFPFVLYSRHPGGKPVDPRIRRSICIWRPQYRSVVPSTSGSSC